MMSGQARSSLVIKGFDNLMITEGRACSHPGTHRPNRTPRLKPRLHRSLAGKDRDHGLGFRTWYRPAAAAQVGQIGGRRAAGGRPARPRHPSPHRPRTVRGRPDPAGLPARRRPLTDTRCFAAVRRAAGPPVLATPCIGLPTGRARRSPARSPDFSDISRVIDIPACCTTPDPPTLASKPRHHIESNT